MGNKLLPPEYTHGRYYTNSTHKTQGIYYRASSTHLNKSSVWINQQSSETLATNQKVTPEGHQVYSYTACFFPWSLPASLLDWQMKPKTWFQRPARHNCNWRSHRLAWMELISWVVGPREIHYSYCSVFDIILFLHEQKQVLVYLSDVRSIFQRGRGLNKIK